MRYGKYVKDGYIHGVSLGGGTECTKEEYLRILDVINNAPTAPEGYGYKLTESLEWELYELPPAEPEELTETEQKALAYDILMGVSE